MDLGSLRDRAEALESEVYALSLAARDDRTPLAAKVVLVAVVGYALSPVDPIPDVVPVLGYLDELVVLPLGVAVARRLVPDHVLAAARRRADEAVDGGRARWVVAGATLLVWAGVAVVAVRAVW